MKLRFSINLPVFVVCASVALALPAQAQPNAQAKAAAEALFDEGKKLLNAGDYPAACQKFEESDKLDPALGTELNLASCYEKGGRTASAWAMFRRVAAVAKTKKQADREKLARDRADALESVLSRLTIVVPDAVRVSGLSVRRNGEPVDPALYGQPVPIDPGAIEIEASAPGKRTFEKSLSLARSQNETLTVPALEDESAAAAPAPPPDAPPQVTTMPVDAPPAEPAPPPDESGSGSSQRTIGLVVGGVGIVGLAVGGYFGLRAQSKNDDSKSECLPSDPNRCSARGVSLRDDARSAGNVATVAGGLGLAAVIGGAVLYFTAPSSAGSARARSPGVALGARVSGRDGSIVLGGAF